MNDKERADMENLAAQVVAEQHDIHVEPITTTTLTPLDDPERDWCAPCGLPSLLRWHMVFEAAGAFMLAALTVCTECGSESWVA